MEVPGDRVTEVPLGALPIDVDAACPMARELSAMHVTRPPVLSTAVGCVTVVVFASPSEYGTAIFRDEHTFLII